MAKFYNAIKVLMKFNSLDGGFTEAHYNLLDKTYNDARASAEDLAQLRLALCGNGVSLQGIRLSDLRDPSGVGVAQRSFKSQLIPLITSKTGVGSYRPVVAGSKLTGLTPSANGSAVVSGQPKLYGRDVDPDQIQTAIMAKYKGGMQAGHWYLAGCPDGVTDVGTTGGSNPADPFWLNNFSAYRNELLNLGGNPPGAAKWGFKARIIAPPPQWSVTPILSFAYSAGVGTNLIATWKAAGGPTFTAGMKVQITLARMLVRELGTVNGFYTLEDDSIVTGTKASVEIPGTAGIDLNHIKTAGFITQVDFTVQQYTDLQIGRQVSHRRGAFHSNFRGRTKRVSP